MPDLDRPAAVRLLDWYTRPSAAGIDAGSDPFGGGVLSVCFNALDRHVIRGLADEPALVDRASGRTLDYAELLQQVAQLGGALRELGTGIGDVVVIGLDDRTATVVAMLACARVGAAHLVVDPTASGHSAVPPGITPRVVFRNPDGVAPGGGVDGAGAEWFIVDHGAAAPPAPEVGGRELALSWLMKPGSFEPAGCVEVPADTVLTHLPDGPHPHGAFGVRLAQAMTEVAIGTRCPVTSALTTAAGQSQIYGPLLLGATLIL